VAARGMTKPKHLKLFAELDRAIRAGVFARGQRLPTEAELMKQYSVSRTTVTRTLRDLEHSGVIWRRRGSGTYIKENKSTATQHFGMMVHSVEPGSIFLKVYEVLAQAIERAEGDLRLTHVNTEGKLADQAVEAAKRLVSLGVKGVFFLPHSLYREGELANQRVTEVFARAGVSVVLLDREICAFPQRSGYDLVSVDNTHGGYLVGQHLIEVGCKRPLFVAESATFSFPSARARWIGCREAWETGGIEPRSFGCDPESMAQVMQAVRDFKPDGIVCDNDRHAAMVMRHLINSAILVPEHMRLAGFDDTPTASLLAVPLTTVRQPAGAIALRAMSLMKDRMAHPGLPPAQVAVRCELVVRESTAGAAAPTASESGIGFGSPMAAGTESRTNGATRSRLGEQKAETETESAEGNEPDPR
jgi:DNA-binding LacI/PurR family transcriptional regulator